MSKVKTLSKKSTDVKEITVKKRELLTISQGLAYINSKETKCWHRISQNLESIATLVFQTNEAHKDLTDRLATKDEHGNPVRNQQNQIDFGDNLDEANKAWDKTLEEEVTFKIYPLLLEDLKDYGLDANIMKPLLGVLVVE